MTGKAFRIEPEPDGIRKFKKPRTGRIALLAIAGLSGAAAFVVFGLPELVKPDQAVVPVTQPAPATAPEPAPEQKQPQSPDGKAEAEKRLAEALRGLARMEGEGVRIWGLEPINEASIGSVEALLERARTLFAQRNHSAALVPLAEAIVHLQRLEASKPARLQSALEAGQKALEARDAALAESHFKVAAAVEPGNVTAESGLTRARNLPDTLRYHEAGAAAERAGKPDAAAVEYQKAVESDKEFEPARTALKRVEAAARAINLNRAIAEVHGRLHSGDINGASAALTLAAGIDPNSPEVIELRKRVSAAVKTAKLEAIRKRAEDLEKQEKWAEALKAYEEALAVDPSVAFGSRGLSSAKALLDLHKNIDSYLEQPTRLMSAGPLTHAAALLSVSQGRQDGPVLIAKKQRLKQLIVAASTPVPVTIRSDRQTSVEVYRIGLIGLLETHRMELPPGKYVAVGSRTGYRDTRVEFEVSPYSPGVEIVVKATEAIR